MKRTLANKIYQKIIKNLGILLVFVFAINFQIAFSQFYNGTQMNFGKNRIQTKEFDWRYYRFTQYDVFFYTGGTQYAQHAAKTVSTQIKELEQLFDFGIDDRLQIVVYNKYTDFLQSNAGLASDDESYNIGGMARIVGSKLFLYFEGDYSKFDKQIRQGITEVVVNQMLYGGNWREVLKNSTFLKLPDWYVQGLISYVTYGWDPKTEDRVRDAVSLGKYKKFNRLSGEEAVRMGHATWNYIADVYGANNIANIIYMARMSRNIESGYLYVLGISLQDLIAEMNNYYFNQYKNFDQKYSTYKESYQKIRTKKNRVYSNLKISADGQKLAYISNEMGQQRLYMFDVNKKKKKHLKRWGHKLERIVQVRYPLLAWHPSNEFLAVLTEEKSRIWLHFYYPETKKWEKREIFGLDEFSEIAFSPDGKNMVFTAIKNGQSDVFHYSLAGNYQKQLTNDIYDDFNAKFIDNNKIVFGSNRPNDSLIVKPKKWNKLNENRDIFEYDLSNKENPLKQLTKTDNIDEFEPDRYGKNQFSFLSYSNGTYNRFVGFNDSAIAFIDTTTHYRYFTQIAQISNSSRNIMEQDVAEQSDKLAQLIFESGKYRFSIQDLEKDLTAFQFMPSDERNKMSKKPKKVVVEAKPKVENNPIDSLNTGTTFKKISVFEEEISFENKQPKVDPEEIDIDNYIFDDLVSAPTAKPEEEKEKIEQPKQTLLQQAVQKSLSDTGIFVFPNARNYYTNFFVDYVVTQLGNNYFNENYQRFSPGAPGFNQPSANTTLKISASDLFEDKRLVGSAGLSFNLRNNEILVGFENRKKRLDHQFLFHRQSIRSVREFLVQQTAVHQLKYVAKFPFSEVAALKATANFRYDKIVTLSTGIAELTEPSSFDLFSAFKLEYIFDNTLNKGINLYHGTRLKIFAEEFIKLNGERLPMTVIGADIRHYQKIYKEFIWASRVAWSTSLGKQKIVFYAGGIDNMIFPRNSFDFSTDISQNENYQFQAIGTNIRGFVQNIRNGNSFAVINNELRLPVFKIISRKPIKSDFLNNFQIIGFGDVGTAWTGTSPLSESNDNNTKVIENNPLTITLKNVSQPVVGGYGFGLRSRLFGYFVRADWAWGVENYQIQERVFYLSLTLDF